jgi:integrase
MAKVRARPETGTLYLDFFYRGVRCREQTALTDTPQNRKVVQAFLNRIVKEIAQGAFDYGATFPDSPRAQRFALQANGPAAAPPATGTIPTTPRFEAFASTWRTEMAPQWRRLHRADVDEIFAKHLLPRFGEREVGAISKADVMALRADLSALKGRGGKPLSASRINKIMTILRQMLNEAADRFGFAPAFRGIKPLKARKPEVQPFSMEEVERIRQTIRADYRNYVTVRFFTGMRTGEINGLKWKNVDFECGLVLVRETYANGEAEGDAKTEQSLRDIPMLPIVRAALEDQLKTRAPGSEYVFSSASGTPIDAHNFTNRVWYPLLRYLDLAKRRPYQTRHTTATLMLAAGENPEWIAKLMGHANTQMLFTVYSRFVPNLTREDGRAITGLLNSRVEHKASEPALSAKDIEAMDVAALRQALKVALSTSTSRKENPHGAA